MRFIVHADVLNSDDTVLTLLDRLVDRLADGVLRVEVPDADLLQESSWYQNARTTRRKVLTSALATPPRIAQSERGPHLRSVDLLDLDSAKLADRLAHTPFRVLVEDRESDGVLLDILVEELGWPELQEYWSRAREITPRATEIVTAGGKDSIPGRIERMIRDAEEENRPPRLFVLCDSDARWPGDSSEDFQRTILAVRQACAKHGVPHHIWQKRASENYIPDQVFEAGRDQPYNSGNTARFNAFLGRSREQKDYFPIKDGLQEGERNLATVAGLYQPAEESELELLETRLFPKRPRLLRRLNEELRSAFTAEGLRLRDGNGELDDLLATISLEL